MEQKEALAPPPPYRELTLAAVLLGIAQGMLMTAAFVYIALKLGFTLPGSTVAAILGFALLRGALRRGTIVENNINQTIASGVNTASAGVAFTLPALFLMTVQDPSLAGFSLWPFILAAISGSFLGVILILPLRKQLIELERLRFPSGIAVASLLRSPGAGMRQAALLAGGFSASALFHTLAFYGWVPEEVNLGGWLGIPSYAPVVLGISFANLGAGLLSGKGGLPFAAGGVLSWWVLSPLATNLDWIPAGEEAWKQQTFYLSMLRPLGIGLLIGGALAGALKGFPALKGALQSLSAAAKARRPGGEDSEELSARVLYSGLGAALLILGIAALWVIRPPNLLQAVLITLVGAFWLFLAGLIVAETTGRTDISPLSGLALIGVTLMFFLTGGNPAASVLLGVTICIGIGQCADMMTDLKTGHLVGALPRRQQLAQLASSWLGAPVAIGVVWLLWQGPGFGPETPLPAPQAGALQGILSSLSGGEAAVEKYFAGAALGAALGLVPVGGLGVLVGLGMYLPFSITLGYGLGCLASMGLQRWKGLRWMGSTLVPMAAGFIVGEALTSLTLVLLRLAAG